MTNKLFNYFIITLLFSTIIFQSCKKSRSDVGAVLFKESKNKVFKNIDSAKYNQVFRKVLSESEAELRSPAVLRAFYSKNEYEPYFIVNLVPDEKFKELLRYYSKAPEHGLKANLFDYHELKSLVDKIYDKRAIKTVDEAYQTIARLEVLTANSLIKYTNALQYGTVNPRRVFARYYMNTKRPDSVSMSRVFHVKDFKSYLDSIQPQNSSYKKLQQALAQGYQYQGLSKEETARIIKLNMERLRWKNKTNDDRYVWVNIPDFRLTYFEGGKAKLNMKVCVGESKEPNYYEKLQEYNETGDIDDRPHNHETPLLNSEIHTIVVNPIWNIPKSIAQSEIATKAAEDPYYLANMGIEVYKDGKKIDSDYIDWDEVSQENLALDFKQSPGDDNALGKMKFLFKNSSSVYLHDTPAKKAFNLNNRAVSHGCVRVEDPLALAQAIAKSGDMFNRIKADFTDSTKDSDSYAIKDKVPVYLDYMTCWVDESDNIQIRPDVYYLDQVLYRKMAKFLA
jgi:murein L,D-transpeptidase YcbB/YkuD